MRALISTDLHSSPEAVRAIRTALHLGGYDVHLCLGDIITFRPLSYLEDLFARPPVLTYTVPGNTDSTDARRMLGEWGLDMHFKQVEVKGVRVAGAGGCPPPPFRTAFVVEEAVYQRELPPVLKDASVLASHAPVKGILDSVMPGIHVGGRALREAVEAARPAVVLSGHIHQARGLVLWDWASGQAEEEQRTGLEADVRGKTLFMNPGPASDGLLGVLEMKGHKVHASIVRP